MSGRGARRRLEEDDDEFSFHEEEMTRNSQVPQKKRGAPADSEEDEDDEEAGPNPSQKRRNPQKKQKRNAYDYDEGEDADFGGTQRAAISAEEREKLVADCVRLILFKETRREPIRKDDIVKYVVKEYKKKSRTITKELLKDAKQRLLDIFGFELVELPKPLQPGQDQHQGSGRYILCKSARLMTALAPILDKMPPPNAQEQGFLMVVLGIIDIFDGKADEDALWNALGLFDLYKNQKVDNLGDPSALLKQFEKQLYLSKSIVRTATANKNEYSLGPRSLVEFGRKMLFRAVGEICGEEPDAMREKELDELDKQIQFQDEAGNGGDTQANDDPNGEVDSSSQAPTGALQAGAAGGGRGKAAAAAGLYDYEDDVDSPPTPVRAKRAADPRAAPRAAAPKQPARRPPPPLEDESSSEDDITATKRRIAEAKRAGRG